MLDLSGNNINDRGLELISRIFEHCIDIKRVLLSRNHI